MGETPEETIRRWKEDWLTRGERAWLGVGVGAWFVILAGIILVSFILMPLGFI